MAEWSKAAVLKTVEGASPPGVRIPISPPRESHTKHLEISVSYFFLHDCFGIVVNFEVPKIENPSHLNYLHQKRDEFGNFCK